MDTGKKRGPRGAMAVAAVVAVVLAAVVTGVLLAVRPWEQSPDDVSDVMPADGGTTTPVSESDGQGASSADVGYATDYTAGDPQDSGDDDQQQEVPVDELGDAEPLSGITADDIPKTSTVANPEMGAAVSESVAGYLRQTYPNDGLTSIVLVGSGSDESQSGDGLVWWNNYAVRLASGIRVGLVVSSGEGGDPVVSESDRLTAGDGMVYDVQSGEYDLAYDYEEYWDDGTINGLDDFLERLYAEEPTYDE